MPFYHSPKTFIPPRYTADKKAVKNGFRHAIFTSKFGKYVGDWNKDLKQGKGYFLTSSSKLYEGNWYRGFRFKNEAGPGRYVFIYNVHSFSVVLHEDPRAPRRYSFSDGQNIYEHGFGVLSNRLSNGTFSLEYRGDWIRGKAEGTGWRYYGNGDVYFGFWKKGSRHGYGKMWFSDGTYYVGYWADGKRHGLGMFVQVNKNRYEGNWEDDHKHGLGRFYHLNTGQVQEGCWDRDLCVKSKMKDIIIRQFCTSPSPYPIPPEEMVNSMQVLEESEYWMSQRIGEIDKQLKNCIDQI